MHQAPKFCIIVSSLPQTFVYDPVGSYTCIGKFFLIPWNREKREVIPRIVSLEFGTAGATLTTVGTAMSNANYRNLSIRNPGFVFY